MAKLSPETAQTIWDLQHQLLEIIDTARTLELSLFDAFGETEDTIPVLDELQSIAQQAIERFSLFSNLQIRVANTQPPIPPDIIGIVDRSIQTTQQKNPALNRSIQEITQEWRLS
ncbi:hypothetical protein [Chamaesiphon polymorphus]|uniref:Uncharacterized protein n=1 Tax=Chamaesiphon polymorphus CCALA 037 TaxID=2107692 RepID=A0A2T1GJQ1_9CYAN|nr:hypothetical protein [Chamaesiphon polymorphus]PSB57932.1 hypothetical protein C7B77_06615 [Chamaesiphon polymorphus CCALA 037]